MSFLLDTNIVSEGRKTHGNPSVAAWIASADDEALHISVLVLGEIRRGIDQLRRRDPGQAAVLEAWLSRLRGEFADRIVTGNVSHFPMDEITVLALPRIGT